MIEDRDPYKLRERDSAAVLCFRCSKSSYSTSKRVGDEPVSKRPRLSDGDADSRRWQSIVSCDYCNLHWHLDCLDPPLTVMPPRGHKWMCPNHVDQVLVCHSFDIPFVRGSLTDRMQPTRRIPKHIHKTIDVERPGVMNNGNIDIIPSEDLPVLGPPVDEVFIGGQRYRVPERVVILDFWDRCKCVSFLISLRIGLKLPRRTTPIVAPLSPRTEKLQSDAIEVRCPSPLWHILMASRPWRRFELVALKLTEPRRRPDHQVKSTDINRGTSTTASTV